MQIYVNTKNYKLNNLESLTELLKQIKQHALPVKLVVPALMLGFLKPYSEFLWLQHADSDSLGAHTGKNSIELVENFMCEGILLNHAERKLENKELFLTIERALAKNFKVMVCSQDFEFLKSLEKFGKNVILAYEPENLIGSDVSVVDGDLSNLQKKLDDFENPYVLGAGVKDNQDILACNSLGASGVLIASKVCKAEDSFKVLQELLQGL